MMMLRNPTQENEEVVEVLLTDKDLTMQLVTRLAMKDKEKLKQGEDSMDSKTEAEILKILFTLCFTWDIARFLAWFRH